MLTSAEAVVYNRLHALGGARKKLRKSILRLKNYEQRALRIRRLAHRPAGMVTGTGTGRVGRVAVPVERRAVDVS